MRDGGEGLHGKCRVLCIFLLLLTSAAVGLSFPGSMVFESRGSSDQGVAANGFVSASTGLPGPPASQHSVWFGDINNDKNLDIATAGYEGVRVWAGDGTGKWLLNSTGLPNSAYDGGVCLGDIDNDGNLDIAAANYDYGAPGVAVWRGNGKGSWTLASAGLPTSRGRTGLFFADMNNDHNLDLAVTSDVFESNPGGVQVFRGNGAGSWTSASVNLPSSGKYYSVWMGDVNNDDNVDLAASGPGLHVWLGNGAGVWSESSNGLPPTDQWNSVTMGDVNLDGNMDIVSALDMGGHGIKAWLGDGKGNWTSASSGLPTRGVYYGVVLADLVGDKYPDILAGNYSGGGVKVFKGDGGSSWVGASSGLPAGKVIGVAAGDINNDGYVDIGAVGETFGVQVWKNDETAPPFSVTVKQPNGGESWEILTQHYINWTTSGGTPPIAVSISYSKNGVTGPYTSVASGEPNDGSYTWAVPNTPSDSCFIRVDATDSLSKANWDKSNSSFRIYLADAIPPTITGLQLPNLSVTGNTNPTIGASYSDASGIALASVILKVDSINVTSSSTVTSTGVTYVPSIPLSEGSHSVYLEARDNYRAHNLATAAWQFTVDTQPPAIANEQPVNQTTVTTSTPVIGAGYSDPSGVSVASIVLEVDSVNVTASATITAANVYFVPSVPMSDGTHNVSLAASDGSSPRNEATKTWWFTIDTTIPDDSPPVIANLQPANYSIISNGRPTISADYSDSSGVNTNSVIIRVDSVNVTAAATVTMLGVTYVPSSALSEGVHNVYLEARDNSANHNRAVATWRFTVDTLPPTITSVDPANRSTVGDISPIISASFADASGIDTSSIILELDSVDVTASSVIYPSDVTYTPPTPLSPGNHSVHLSVSDNAVPANTATSDWWFIIDNLPPEVTGMQPTDRTITSDTTPLITASYFDASGIATSSVTLTVDSVNVTSSSAVTLDDVTYSPSTPLSEGVHTVHLEVSDASALHNRATAAWEFTVDSVPPSVANLQPENHMVTADRKPTIGASYSDSSGISVAGVVLRLDAVNLTSSAVVTDKSVTLTLDAGLTEGNHIILLLVPDRSEPPNFQTVQWSFEIHTTPPLIAHEPVASGTANRDITITAQVTDSIGVGNVTLYYRVSGTQHFSHATMTKPSTGNTYSGVIQASVVTTAGVEYYIEASDNMNNTARRPGTDWLTSPYVITVAPQAGGGEFPVVLVTMAVVVLVVVTVAVSLVLWTLKKKKGRTGPKEGETEGPERPE